MLRAIGCIIIILAILGLLVTPSNLGPVVLPGLAITFILMFVARPIAVAPILAYSTVTPGGGAGERTHCEGGAWVPRGTAASPSLSALNFFWSTLLIANMTMKSTMRRVIMSA